MADKQTNNSYDHREVEKKWRESWKSKKLYKTPEDATKENKYYILPQLPYPSGSGLHVGHAEVYSGCDILARFKRMKGEKVLQVIGWDAFGLPAENFAIKTNIHPRINTDKAIDNFRDQITKMGVSVDLDREVGSHNPDYYKWTQWFFLLMYNQGLAYRKNQKVNWCPSCKTVLANEQVVNKDEKEVCERCDTEIEHKMMEQWYLKITDYADRLSKDLDKVDWPKETVKRQRDWIGKSVGALVKFEIADQKGKYIEVFTTAHDTIFGATYLVIAPEHPFVEELTKSEQKVEVEDYVKSAKKKSEIERTDLTKEKTGIFTGSHVINPMTRKEIPIWVADYALVDYGTGAVMGVPGHDERDYEFANKFNLDVPFVVKEEDGFVSYANKIKKAPQKYTMKNSGEFDGLDFKVGRKKMLEKMVEMGVAKEKTTYKLRDWSVSRQRFWGAPIPMLHKALSKEEEKLNTKYQRNPDLFISFHAWGSSPKDHYYPWLENELAKQNIEMINPVLPNANEPVIEGWMEKMEQEIKAKVSEQSLENAVVSGRSLGGWAALKFVESHKVRKLILVAPSTPTKRGFETWKEAAENNDVYAKLVKFIGGENVGKDGNIDFEKVRKNVDEIVYMESLNDPYLDYKQSEEYLRARFPFLRSMQFRDAGHFGAKNGFDKFPKLLEEILSPVHLDLKPVFADDLPVILPDDVDFKPTGESPLRYSRGFQKGVEAKYGKEFSREPDTLDTFMCSSWYYYRYLDPKNDQAFASPEALKKWMPVDFYLGGPEHVNGHLLYSRFFTKVLYDAGFVDFDEPFMVHRHQGLILGEDHRKMSKRWGNVINPTDVVEEHGADTLRMYEMFMGPLSDDKPWSTKGVMGIRRFLGKVWFMNERVAAGSVNSSKQQVELGKLIQKVEADIEKLGFNTAIAKMMEFANMLGKEEVIDEGVWKKFLLVLAPFAPFITEELWQKLGNTESIHLQRWPEYKLDKDIAIDAVVMVQINGKIRDKVIVKAGSSQAEVEKLAMEKENVKKYLEGKSVKKVFFVQDKLISFVI